MKSRFTPLYLIFFALFAGIMISACSPETNVEPRHNDGKVDLAADGVAGSPHPVPDPQCSTRDTYKLVDAQARLSRPEYPESYGISEILNDPDEIYWLVTLGRNWFINKARIYLGSGSTIPVSGNLIDVNAFPVQETIIPVTELYSYLFKRSILREPCNTVVFNAEIVRLAGFFGGIDERSRTTVWAGTNRYLNGFTVPRFCFVDCMPLRPRVGSVCSSVYLGYPTTECTTLIIEADGGRMPYEYIWSTGATTQSIQVCPRQTTLYSATITDANGEEAVTDFTVNAIDATCQNNTRKVLVCHVPPGNPANAHTICINKSGAPAHVDPNSQGHNSGCHIGPCEPNPCAP